MCLLKHSKSPEVLVPCHLCETQHPEILSHHFILLIANFHLTDNIPVHGLYNSHPPFVSPELPYFAYLTLRIRALKKHLTSFRKDKVSKSMLSEKIAKRRKMLKILKKQNMINFQWLTKELRILYAPVPKYIYWPMTKKGNRKRRSHKKAFRMKIQKIEKLREKYREEKIIFDAYKAETLSEIEKDLKDLNLSIDDVYDPVALSKKERVKKEKVQFQGRIWY
ncbi:28S ribosomal protein S15, mitochondrial [Octopus bimaculoides]|uniref:28S ribosomal protein S15, mitochondrial n=1 Tax=Octopus bimaculoides TaxID=37653 RepID=UPI00071C7969|nr:28S ribosomal protein S15, mitochondrial [Octopus bimaculoides]|eukprot:XP_014770642.1 PREDICTED: 28S ribosomal protein S15, mitochondrial-like [Octopus bimaculoides]